MEFECSICLTNDKLDISVLNCNIDMKTNIKSYKTYIT